MTGLRDSRDDGVATLTLDRPARRNALDAALCAALPDALERLAADREVRCVVLTGAGGAFCAGGDVGDMGGDAPPLPEAERVARLRRYAEAARLLHVMPKPTIAAIEGAAAGAGLSLALACDLRVVARGAKLTTAFVRVGLSGDYGGSWFLPRLVGPARARELYLLSPVLSGEEADRLGLATRLVDDGQALAQAHALARDLVAGPAGAQAAIKANLLLAETATLDALLDAAGLRHVRSAGTDEHRAAAAAFRARRTAPVATEGQEVRHGVA